MVNQAFNTNNVGSSGLLTITVTQISQDWVANTSDVKVVGTIRNNGSGRSTGSKVTRDITGDGSYNPDKFDFNLGPQDTLDFISHQFTITHGSGGLAHVNFTVEFGDTGTGTFGSGSSASVGLELTEIPRKPDKPQNLRITAISPTSISLAWDVPDSDEGNAIYNYDLRTFRTSDQSDQPTHNLGNSRTRNITGLDAGGKYWFQAFAMNHAGDNGGISNPSNTVFNQQQPGVWVRVAGSWVTADVYVRQGGVWKLATPYVRNGQTTDGSAFWKTTI